MEIFLYVLNWPRKDKGPFEMYREWPRASSEGGKRVRGRKKGRKKGQGAPA